MNIDFDDPLKRIHTETMLLQDQTKAESPVEKDIKNFIELEKKKYKKTDDLKDMINH